MGAHIKPNFRFCSLFVHFLIIGFLQPIIVIQHHSQKLRFSNPRGKSIEENKLQNRQETIMTSFIKGHTTGTVILLIQQP